MERKPRPATPGAAGQRARGPSLGIGRPGGCPHVPVVSRLLRRGSFLGSAQPLLRHVRREPASGGAAGADRAPADRVGPRTALPRVAAGARGRQRGPRHRAPAVGLDPDRADPDAVAARRDRPGRSGQGRGRGVARRVGHPVRGARAHPRGQARADRRARPVAGHRGLVRRPRTHPRRAARGPGLRCRAVPVGPARGRAGPVPAVRAGPQPARGPPGAQGERDPDPGRLRPRPDRGGARGPARPGGRAGSRSCCSATRTG